MRMAMDEPGNDHEVRRSRAGAHQHPPTEPKADETALLGAGNRAVSRLLTEPGPERTARRRGTAHAMLDEGSQGDEEFVPQQISFGSAGPDVAPAPVNDEGLIDGEWVSETAATVFVNAGKAGSGLVNWAGGNGGTTPGIGSVTAVAPVIVTRAAGDAGTAAAWVRTGTGTVNVSRHFFGVPTGANGTYYITATAAARIDTHEQNHITHSRTAHDSHLVPLETRVAARTGEANALGGATEAAARAALEAELRWNGAITDFRNADIGFNLPGGSVDTADAGSAGWYHDLGPRTVGGVNYAHYVDV